MVLVSWLRRFCRFGSATPPRATAAPQLRVMRLESRRVLNASALLPALDHVSLTDPSGVRTDEQGGLVIDAGSFADDGSADLFEISGDAGRITVSVNGSQVFSGRADGITGLTVNGSSDADALRVDLGDRGLPIAAVRFDGGEASSATDSLTLVGRASEIDHTLLGGGDGRSVASGVRIDYAGVEVLRDAVETASRQIELSGATSSDLHGTDFGAAIETDGMRFEFGRADRLTIDLDDGSADELEVAGLGGFTGEVRIDGDDSDRVRFTGRSDLGDGSLRAEGGEIVVAGTVRADGEIGLYATSELTVDAGSVVSSRGGSIELHAGDGGRLTVAGTIDVSDDGGVGGEVHLLGRRVDLVGDARIDADGAYGGGTILVGGDYQGRNAEILNALRTTIGPGVILSADANEVGGGGRVIVWADGVTRYQGELSARGGRLGGDGGFAEVSGKESLAFLGTADLSAAQGVGGTLLLDPRTITVVASTPNLNGDGTTGDDLAGTGDLDEESDQGVPTNSIITAGAIKALLEGGQSLILTASRRIDIDAAISVTTGTAGLTLVADLVAIDAAISIGGTFEVRAENLEIGAAGAIVTPGAVVLATKGTGVAINLGGADNPGLAGAAVTLGLTNAELAAISAGTLTIGSGSADAITLTSDITSPAALLVLISGKGIATFGLPVPTGPGITASSLVIRAGGDVRLTGDNAVGSLAGLVSSAGDVFEFANRTGDLMLATLGGVTGVETNAGAITISSAGDLTVDADVDSGSRAVTLSAGGSIDLGSGREIDGGTATVRIAGGTLIGAGTVTGNLEMANGASIAPGAGIGALTVVGNLALQSGSTFVAEIDDDRANPPGAPIAGTDYDRLVVSGSATVQTGALLSLSRAGSSRIDEGDAYVLIDAAGGLSGAFSGFADGSTIVDFGGPGVDAAVSYAGGEFVIQVVGPVVFSAPADGNANTLRVVRNGGLIEFYVDGGVNPVATSVLAAAESVTIVGADGEDDHLTVDFSGGAFGVELTFEGGAFGNDELTLSGGSFETITHRFFNAQDGRVELEATGPDESIVYTDLEPITDNLSAVNRVFLFEGGAETITLTDAAAAGANTIDSTLGESVTFLCPTGSLTIDAGGGDDVVEIASIDAVFHASVVIDGGAGVDVVRLSAALTLGSGAVTGDLDVTGERIVLAANLRTDGGLAGGDVTFTGAVELAASVSIDSDGTAGDGTVTFAGTVDADLEANGRVLVLTAGGGDIAFQGAVGSSERIETLTVASADDVDFASAVHVVGDLVQTAGSGTTTLRGGSVGGDLEIASARVAFAAGGAAVVGTAAVTAATSIRGGTWDGAADLAAASITLSVTAAAGNLGVGATGAALEIATAGVLNAATSAGGGDLFLRAIGDFRLGLVDAGSGDASLSATGAIVDARAGDGVGNVNVSATAAVLSAATGIGAADAIDTVVGTLSASGGSSGDVRIDEVDAVTVVGAGLSAGGIGTIVLRAGTSVTVNAAVQGGGDVTLVATGGSVALGANVEAGAAGSVRLLAGTTISQTAGRVSAGSLGATAAGSVSLSALTNDVEMFAGTSTNGSLAFTDADGFTLGTVTAAGDFAGAIGASAAAGDVTLRTVAGSMTLAANVIAAATGTVRLASGGAISQTAGGISARDLGAIAGTSIDLVSLANDVDVFAASAAGDVAFLDADGFTVRSVAAAGGFSLMTGVSGLNVTLRAETGDLGIDASIAAGTTAGVVRLSAASGGISQTSGSITGQFLGVRAGAAGVDLSGAGNDVAQFAAEAGGSILYRDATGFTVGGVSGTGLVAAMTGVRSSAGDVTLRAGGALLTLNADVASAATGTVRLVSGAGIAQSAGGVRAAALGVRAAGDVSLLGPGNDVDVFAAANAGAGGRTSLRDADGLTIGSVAAGSQFSATAGLSTSNGDVLVVTGLGGVAGDGDLTISAAVSAGTGVVRVDADGSVVQAGGASITAGALGVRAGGPVFLLEPANDVSTFAARTAGGVVSFRDADGLTVGSVTAFADPGLFGATAGVVTDAGAAGADVLLVTGLGGAVGNGALAVNAGIAAGAGTVRISADGSVTQSSAITAAALGVRTTSGNITLFASNDVGVFAARTEGGAVGLGDTNAVTIGTVTALADPALFAETVGVRTGGGNVALSGSFIAFDQAVSSGGGSVLVQADDIAINAAIDATAAGLVQMTPRTNGGAITLGGPGGLSLDAFELNLITARLLAVGGLSVDVSGSGVAASTGRITVAGRVAPAGVSNLSFLTGADVFGAAGGEIAVAGAVVFDVGTGVSGSGGSDGTFFEVAASGFAGRVRSAGDFRISSLGDVVVGLSVAVDPIAVAGTVTAGLAGVTTQSGTVGIEARDGNLTVASALSVRGTASDLILRAVGAGRDLLLNSSVSGDRSVVLSAGRDIVQATSVTAVTAPAVSLTAGRNVGSAGTPIELHAGVVAARSLAGDVFVNEDAAGGGLTVGTVAGLVGVSAQGAVRVTTEAGDLVVSAAIGGGTVRLASGTAGVGSTTIAAAIGSLGSLDVTAAGALSTAATGSIGGGDVSLRAAGLVSLGGSVAAVGSVQVASSAGAVIVGGALTAGRDASFDARGGSLTLNAAVAAAGAADFRAAAAVTSSTAGRITAGTVSVAAAGQVSLLGEVAASGHASVVSTAAGIALGGPVAAGGNLLAEARGAGIGVSAAITAGGLLGLDASAAIVVSPGGTLSGAAVRLDAGGGVSLAGAVRGLNDVAVTAGGGVTSSAAGVITGGTVAVAAAGPISLAGDVSASSHASVTSTGAGMTLTGRAAAGGDFLASAAGAIAVGGPFTAGRDASFDARGGPLTLNAAVTAGGVANFGAVGAVTSSSAGTIRAANVTVGAAGPISLLGDVSAAGDASVVSTGSAMTLGGRTTTGGMFLAEARGGGVGVSGAITAGGLLGLDASVAINITSGAALNGAAVRLDAGAGVSLAGSVRGLVEVVVTAGAGTLSVAGAVSSGGSLQLDARAGSIVIGASGNVAGGVVTIAAVGGDAMIAGSVSATLDLSIDSTGQAMLGGPVSAGTDLDVAARGPLSVAGTVSAGAAARFESLSNVTVLAGGSIRGLTLDIAARGAVSLAGTLDAVLDAGIASGAGSLTVAAAVTAGRDLAMLAGTGDLFLGANVAAGGMGTFVSARGSVLQPSAGVTVAGGAASLLAAGSIGTRGSAIDLAVGQVAAGAVGGGVWLTESAGGGSLTVAVLGTQRGVTSTQAVEIATRNGDLVLAAPVKGATVALAADRAAGSPERGRVVFDRGYAETPTGRVVGAPPGILPVNLDGITITRFDLASPFVVSFGIVAGNVADTVDGRLADRGLSVTVDFVQPGVFDGSQSRMQSQTDSAGLRAGGAFGPFSFRYSELFLQEQLILGAAREQLFEITVTAEQDPTISVEERLGGVVVSAPTQQTFAFGDVSTSPTEQSLSIPLGIVSPVLASIEIPAIVERAEPVVATEPPRVFTASASLPLESATEDYSGASAGANSVDRPRLFLVWRRPGVSGPPANIEIDLIWFARDYQRQLIGFLKEGRYWFELAEPGSPSRQLGDSFYVRNGRVIDDPAAVGPAANEAPAEPLSDRSFDSGEGASPDAGAVIDGSVDVERAAGSSSPAPASAAIGLAGLLALRRRRRLTVSPGVDDPPRLAKASRLSRRVRRVTALRIDEPATSFGSSRDLSMERAGLVDVSRSAPCGGVGG